MLTPLHVRVMDSSKWMASAELPVQHFSVGMRLWRACKRLGLVSGVGLLLIPVPLMHICGAAVALVVGPLAAAWAAKPSACMGECEVACPRCGRPVALSNQNTGWPVRVQCLQCSSMIELTPT